MEEKRLTEKESLELIIRMIENTKKRINVGDGNMMLLWGYISVIVAVSFYIACMITHNPICNVLWWLIPIVGISAEKHIKRKKKPTSQTITYIDRISIGIWKIVGTMAFAGMVVCLGFTLSGYGYRCWLMMLLYAFIIIGFGTAVQGVVIRERSMILGGIVSIVCGGFVACCALSGINLEARWIIPLYIICFALMMIVPGHIINNKAKKVCQGN